MSSSELVCFSCGTKNKFLDQVSFRAECEKCRADLHACKNCKFYDPKSYNECRESSADPVSEKERANYCDYFKPFEGDRSDKSEKEKLKNMAESHFKK